MTLGIVPYRIENECLAQQHLNLVIAPVLCGERLQEHDDSLWEAVLRKTGDGRLE